jgi:hypothetical protein
MTVETTESNLERAKRLTQERVDAGLLHPWVMGDHDQRDRFNQAADRRAAFSVVTSIPLSEAQS